MEVVGGYCSPTDLLRKPEKAGRNRCRLGLPPRCVHCSEAKAGGKGRSGHAGDARSMSVPWARDRGQVLQESARRQEVYLLGANAYFMPLVAAKLMSMRGGGRPQKVPWRLDSCIYHEHVAEGKPCYKVMVERCYGFFVPLPGGTESNTRRCNGDSTPAILLLHNCGSS